MNSNSIRRSVTVVAAALGFSTACLATEPIKIGSVLSITGNASIMGEPQQKTLHLYVDKINAAGGVQGRKIELIVYDDASSAEKANSFTKRLIQQDQVDLILGASSTGATMSMVPLVESAKVPTISFGGASVVVEPVKPHIFKTPHSDRMAAKKILEDMKQRGITQMGLLSDTGGFGKSGRAETLEAAKSIGVEIVSDQSYGDKDNDMTPQITKIRGSSAQALLVFGTGQAPAIIARNFQQLGLKIPLYMSHGQADPDFIRLAGKAAEGIRLPTPALLIADQLPNDDPQKAVGSSYKNGFETAYKMDVSTFGGYAYDGLMLALDAIKRAGGTDREKVREALEQTKNFIGVGGVFNMSPTDHMGLDLSAFRIVTIQNGAFTELK